MAKKQVIKFSEFMSGEYKVKEQAKKKETRKKAMKVASSLAVAGASGSWIPLLVTVPVFMPMSAFASEGQLIEVPAQAVPSVPVTGDGTVSGYLSSKTLNIIAHALDPLVEVLVALAFPVVSVVITGACFFFIFGNQEKAWSMITRAGLGYALIQMSPFILNVLKEVGDAL